MITQIGRDQKGSFEFYANEILPALTSVSARPRTSKATRARGCRMR